MGGKRSDATLAMTRKRFSLPADHETLFRGGLFPIWTLWRPGKGSVHTHCPASSTFDTSSRREYSHSCPRYAMIAQEIWSWLSKPGFMRLAGWELVGWNA